MLLFFFMIFFFNNLLFIFMFIFFFVFLSNNMLKSENLKKNLGTFTIYECSYNMMSNTSFFYTLQFFLIAMSFMFFDLEVVLFFPFIFTLFFYNNIIISILLFLIFLTSSLLMEFTLKIF